MGTISNLVGHEGIRAVGVVDFNGIGEAEASVTIDGVSYTEADTADAANGVWTNGASAADGATSLAAAIDGDERSNAPKVSAFVSDEGNSVVVVADEVGTAGNLTVTTDSAANITVENLHGGEDGSRRRMVCVTYEVTDQDVLADECNIPLPFTPTDFIANVRDTNGLIDAVTANFTIESDPDRLRCNFAGATDPVAGDQICAVIWA